MDGWSNASRGRGQNGTQCMWSHPYNGSVVFLCKYFAHQSYFLKHWDKKDLSIKAQKGYFPVKLCKWPWHLDVKSVIWGSSRCCSSYSCNFLHVARERHHLLHVEGWGAEELRRTRSMWTVPHRQKYLQWWFSGLHWINGAAGPAAFIFRLRKI